MKFVLFSFRFMSAGWRRDFDLIDLMLSVVFLTLEGLRSAGIGDLKDPIEEVEVDDKGR